MWRGAREGARPAGFALSVCALVSGPTREMLQTFVDMNYCSLVTPGGGLCPRLVTRLPCLADSGLPWLGLASNCCGLEDILVLGRRSTPGCLGAPAPLAPPFALVLSLFVLLVNVIWRCQTAGDVCVVARHAALNAMLFRMIR